MGKYCPPYYNPYDKNLVNFLKENEYWLKKEIPTYYKNWLNKDNHFKQVYKHLKEYIDNVWT
jgi:CRISPR/Cas system-associated endonuclease/helicase Cas3